MAGKAGKAFGYRSSKENFPIQPDFGALAGIGAWNLCDNSFEAIYLYRVKVLYVLLGYEDVANSP